MSTLDYTAGGSDFNAASAARDIGAGDEIHGESGDDTVYGMVGNDVIFGESGDDDLIGGIGNDWLSGGTGSDGILGDDGRIMTSRNGSVELLSGVTVASVQSFVSTPGKIQQATTNITGELKKTVNLTPFNVDPSGSNPLFAATHSDDLIFGGLGDDFLHGGVGDDGLSGAEALGQSYALNDALTGVIRSDYTNPFNNGGLLRYNAGGYNENRVDRTLRAGEFALYDEYNPLRKILIDPATGLATANGTGVEWLLNFSSIEGGALGGGFFTDGEDAIFGDLGNDWLVGGTGRDNLYGGYGNDLLNADDDLRTASGQNNTPDTHVSYEDRAFGGAGRDVLIANTGGDRLIDWAGEFNSYLVPFAPFGLGTVSRALQPQIAEFLYALAASDGVDLTRASDSGSDPLRNGEPDGELGLVRQQDDDWQTQTGAPSDIQPGNIPGGARDVLRTADFNNGQLQGFATDSGRFSVSGGALTVTAASNNGDAVAVFEPQQLPTYFELKATVTVDKPTAGWKANAYLIFDYQNEMDFKFAGLDVSTSKLVMGHRDASGWIIDTQVSVKAGLKIGTAYNLLLAVNGTTVTLVSNNAVAFSHTYAARVIEGVTYGFNYGAYGFGSNQARGKFDNFALQVLPPAITYQSVTEFTSSAGPVFGAATVGNWSVGQGVYRGSPATGETYAVSLADIGASTLQANSWLEVGAKLKTNGTAGFVFDRYSDDDFKFVAIDVVAGRILIGHHTAQTGYVIDASASRALSPSLEHTLTLTLKGSTVSVSVNGAFGASWAFNALTVDGRFGLLVRSGSASFDSVSVKTDDPWFRTAGQALVAASAASAGDSIAVLTDADLQRLVGAALQRMQLDPSQRLALGAITVRITDLPGLELGAYRDGMILIDLDAAGHGWFVDATPGDDAEYVAGVHLLHATGGEAAAGIDLLSVLVHEFGHATGLIHADEGVMAAQLDQGIRTVEPVATVLPSPLAAVPAVAVSRASMESRLATAGFVPAVPTINWSGVYAEPVSPLALTKPVKTQAWQSDFVNNLARSEAQRNPNANLRVQVNVAPKLTAELSSLHSNV